MSLNKFLSEVKNASERKESIVTNKERRKTESEVCFKRKDFKTNKYIQKLLEYY